MKTQIFSTLCFILLHNSVFPQRRSAIVPVQPGVSVELAKFRHSAIRDIQYTLNFDIPSDTGKRIAATETIAFNWTAKGQKLQIDFKESREHLKSMTINGKATDITMSNEHILINPDLLKRGLNEIRFNFIAGETSLNRNKDYMYGLFVPEKARTFYPCFDQPDLKAKFLLTLKIPTGWKVLANAIKKDSVIDENGITFQFKNTDLLPTYLFSFAAGKFSCATQNTGALKPEFLYRETDLTKIRLSKDSIFADHKYAVKFLEQWTGIPFPFQKLGFVAIPDFQYGGMEHPGEVEYNAADVFLDTIPTKNQIINRLSIISHETAHMWFGDMVTMKWFDDVWMKEVFANFMADKVTEHVYGKATYDLRFLQDHYPNAYSIDRTAGANPTRQKLENLADAGSLYGNIIYHKAPIMMRQLEKLVGKENFRRSAREYLRKFAYRNADWNDLITILKTHSTKNLDAWNNIWVSDPGRPIFTYTENDRNDVIQKFVISQHAEFGYTRNWPQSFQMTFVYGDHNKVIPVNITGSDVEVIGAKGLKKPFYVIFNSDGTGYGVFPLDSNTRKILYAVKDPVERTSIYINAYENMLSGNVFRPKDLLMTYLEGVNLEKDETTLRLLCNYVKNIYWNFITPQIRDSLSVPIETTLWLAMGNQITPNNKLILFKAYQDVFTSSQGEKRIYSIWKYKQPPTGVHLEEDDYISLALTIALKTDKATAVIREQRDRVKNEERKNRLTYLIDAFSTDQKVRDAFFNKLADRKNRKKEPWVITALTSLNHPLRQPGSVNYIPKSLEMLEEIQNTGGVFFPQNWINAVLGSYQSKEAYQYVLDFLSKHPDYNPKLKLKILQAADNLYRAQNGLVQ